MNEISSNYCFRDEIHISFLTYTQLVTVSIFNELVMVGNVIGNTLVIYVLIKTKHLSNVACKLIFMLSVSDLMVGAFGQNLFFAMLVLNVQLNYHREFCQCSSQAYLVTQ